VRGRSGILGVLLLQQTVGIRPIGLVLRGSQVRNLCNRSGNQSKQSAGFVRVEIEVSVLRLTLGVSEDLANANCVSDKWAISARTVVRKSSHADTADAGAITPRSVVSVFVHSRTLSVVRKRHCSLTYLRLRTCMSAFSDLLYRSPEVPHSCEAHLPDLLASQETKARALVP